MRSGVRLGIDVGKARIGVARSDFHGMLASPVETVPRDLEGDAHVAPLVALIQEHEAIEVLIGLPLALSGNETASTQDARKVAEQLAAVCPVPIRFVDERLSTVSASAQLRASGKKPSRSRDRIDQLAAVVILQNALEAERSSGRPPGTLLNDESEVR
ncbi:Holliday junction resolvase RuvX [Pseudoclavibacter alba]|uniref:Putative pre-16S rRNA nuclease n=1 Tax=Pseudoclavibacter albus TaxID=272241 RepID=A0ABT2HUH4_9MICO|nr:Holliday junction resolvase RuvX [Pseudoclavibacter alba]MBN6777939.1 Holliday junction resolvase RuvX [Pseudoclavibacter alba]MCT2041966.1 Holliday junction resolvase RuvX [Pseudoclavibacter alba]